MRRNIFYRKIPAALAAFVLALALCCQTAAAGRALVPGGYTVGIKLYAEGLMVTEVESGTPAQQAGIRKRSEEQRLNSSHYQQSRMPSSA